MTVYYPRARVSYLSDPVCRFLADLTAPLFLCESFVITFSVEAFRFILDPWTGTFSPTETFRLLDEDGNVLTDGEGGLTW